MSRSGSGGASGDGPRVLYVAGWGRSGSTLLSRIVAGRGVIGIGEVRWLWRRGVIARQSCSCRASWDACPVWSPAIEAAIEGVADDPVVAAHRIDALATTAYRALDRGRRSHSAVTEYSAVLGRLYRALAEAARADVLVDSSKAVGPALAARRSGVPTTVVHLVRDPRAVVWSFGRAKRPPEGVVADAFRVRPPWYVTARWVVRNAQVEAQLRPDLRLRYEDVVSDPAGSRSTISEALGVPLDDGPETEHLLAGNLDRFGSGPLVLRPDVEWQERQPAGQRRVATALALPLLRRYDYPLRP